MAFVGHFTPKSKIISFKYAQAFGTKDIVIAELKRSHCKS